MRLEWSRVRPMLMERASIVHDAEPEEKGFREKARSASLGEGASSSAAGRVRMKCTPTSMHPVMCITASFEHGIGNHARRRRDEQRPVRLKVGWEMAGEGKPTDPAQARMQMSIHVKVVGLLLVQRACVPTRMRLRTSSLALTPWNAAGTLGGCMA